jgi:hypothetical protein
MVVGALGRRRPDADERADVATRLPGFAQGPSNGGRHVLGLQRTAHLGHLVVNADSVAPIVKALRSLFSVRFPIRQMRLVDYFAASDERSMANDNTSAFNCRIVPGTSTRSQHALGRAVDVNPQENPEVQGARVDPPSAKPWANRSLHAVGMIHRRDAAWRVLAPVGWKWGGDWTALKDFQHFSANGY